MSACTIRARFWCALLAASAVAGCVERESAGPSVVQDQATGLAMVVVPPPIAGGAGLASVGCAKPTTCLTLLSERGFSCVTLPNTCERDWSVLGTVSSAHDPLAPMSPPDIAQMSYPAGFPGGISPANTWLRLNHPRLLHVTTWIRFSPGFVSHGSGVNKILHFWINGGNRAVLIGRGQELVGVIALQGIAAPYGGAGGAPNTSVHLLPNLGTDARLSRGDWHRIDVLLRANTPGVADGELMLLVGGRKVAFYSGIMYAPTGGNSRWEWVFWDPTWGGTGEIVPVDMYMQMDHIVVRGGA